MWKIELIFIVTFVGNVEKCFSRRSEDFAPVKIGGLFDNNLRDAEMAFTYAITSCQNDRLRYPVPVEGLAQEVSDGNELNTAETACKMIENGVIGIVGPPSPEAASHVRSICDSKEIPLIETTIGEGISQDVINLHPTAEDLGQVYLDMIYAWDWLGFTILYEDAPWLPLVEHILENYNKATVTVRQLDITANKNYRPQLRRVKLSQDKNIVLCSSIESLPEILKQAQQVGLMTDEHQFIITSLDMHTIDLEPYQYSGANITGFRMVSPDDPYVKHVTQRFEEFYKEENPEEDEPEIDNAMSDINRDGEPTPRESQFPEGLSADKIRLNTALTYDAVVLFSNVMSQHGNIAVEGMSCDDPTSTFVNGTSILNSMKTVSSLKGLSGDIHIDSQGNRKNYNLDILELASDGLKKVGMWNSTKGIQSLRGMPFDNSQTDPHILMNKTLKVLTVINHPYGMLKETLAPLHGNDQYEGFGIELIEKLAQRLGFKVLWELQHDKKYGSLTMDGEWNGMIKELREDRADLAITDLTITAERESGVDFTMPFMNLGISILYEKPKKEDPELFSFLAPFSGGVWGCVGACFFLVSFSLFVMGRISPEEWDNPFPCIEEPEVLINQLNFKNSMWFSVGALLQQGSEIAPKAPSTRLVASMWWFFTLIMVSSYTANLAAFLVVEKPFYYIESVDDLVAGKVKYGAKYPGSTYEFFRSSSDEKYQIIGRYLEANKAEMPTDNDIGIALAEKGKYAFLMESSTIEYTTQRNCEVVQIGDKLDEKGYGIAMKKDSPYRGALSEAVLQMLESGEISRMKTKWWKEKRGGGACGAGGGDSSAQKLNMKNVGGVFVVLFGGCGVALVLGLFRWYYNIKQMSKTLEVPIGEVFKEEFRFFRQFGTNTKTLQTRKSSTQLGSMSGSRSNVSRSRSSANNDRNGIRMSSKNLKSSLDDPYSGV